MKKYIFQKIAGMAKMYNRQNGSLKIKRKIVKKL